MFRALLRPSSGTRVYNVEYQVGHFGLGLPAARTLLQPNHT